LASPRCFGSGELGGGELGAQIISLALECPPIGHIPFDHSLQRGVVVTENSICAGVRGGIR
jgi:hypothetical protein